MIAIIAKALPAPEDWRDNYLKSDWHRILSAFLETRSRATDEESDGLCAGPDEAAHAICAKPVCTFDDLVVCAAIAVH